MVLLLLVFFSSKQLLLPGGVVLLSVRAALSLLLSWFTSLISIQVEFLVVCCPLVSLKMWTSIPNPLLMSCATSLNALVNALGFLGQSLSLTLNPICEPFNVSLTSKAPGENPIFFSFSYVLLYSLSFPFLRYSLCHLISAEANTSPSITSMFCLSIISLYASRNLVCILSGVVSFVANALAIETPLTVKSAI